MAASFIRRKAAIMCHYPWAMIFLPLPRVVFFCFFSLLLSFKQHLDIYSEKKSHSQQQNNRGDGFPLHGYKMKAKQTLSSLPARREGGRPSGPRSDARALRGRAAPPTGRGAGHEVLGARLCPLPGKGREDFWSPRSLLPCTRPSGDLAHGAHAPLRSSPRTSGHLGRISPGSQHGLLVPFNVGSFLPVLRLASCLDSPEEAAVFIEQGRELCPLVLPNPHKAAAAEAGTELPPTRWKRGGGGRQSKPQADPKLPHPLQIVGSSPHLPPWALRAPLALSLPLQHPKCPCPPWQRGSPRAEAALPSHPPTHTPPRDPPQTPAGLSRPPSHFQPSLHCPAPALSPSCSHISHPPRAGDAPAGLCQPPRVSGGRKGPKALS